MRIVNGKTVRQMDAADVAGWTAKYEDVTVDLGAGDGRFVRHLAQRHPELGAVAVDLCAANMARASRGGIGNALFVVADALALPDGLRQAATRVTIHFPWGSLLRGLLGGHLGLFDGLRTIARDGAVLEITVNAEALADVGWTMETGSDRVVATLHDAGVRVTARSTHGSSDLRHLPTTWAKRLAFGRDPRAVRIEARMGLGELPELAHNYLPQPDASDLTRWS